MKTVNSFKKAKDKKKENDNFQKKTELSLFEKECFEKKNKVL